MKKILAVSGGVDSMVLFEMIRGGEVVVGHFDHGVREDSGADAEFVEKMCRERGVECVVGRAKLGAGASEAAARAARYEFLEGVARRYGGEIYTAQHVDDLVESVVINLLRGTGWRGLAPMGRAGVRRPLIERGWRKRDVWRYAGERGVRFREDSTNNEGRYLRNRVREGVAEMYDDDIEKVARLCKRQGEIRVEIEGIMDEILPENGVYQRGWFEGMDERVGMEILRAGLMRRGVRVTRRQLREFWRAVREYGPGKDFNLPGGMMVRMYKTYFVL